METSITVYYAVNKHGQGFVFADRPMRDEHFGTWVGKMVGCVAMFVSYLETDAGFELPRITFSDDPVPIAVNVGYRR